MAKTRIASEEFIKAWESSSNVAEVSKKLGLKPASVMARASKYRTAPLFMPLKQMKRGAKIDIAKRRSLMFALVHMKPKQHEEMKVRSKKPRRKRSPFRNSLAGYQR